MGHAKDRDLERQENDRLGRRQTPAAERRAREEREATKRESRQDNAATADESGMQVEMDL